MRFFLTLIFLLLVFLSIGQIQPKEEENKFSYYNSFNVELLGHGGIYSINYERLLVNSARWKAFVQGGFSFVFNESYFSFLIPTSVSGLYSFKSHHIEFGAGQSIYYEVYSYGGTDFFLYAILKLGYRYQKPDGRFMMRIAFTPIIDYWDSLNNSEYYFSAAEFYPWGGLTFGYVFGK